MNSESEFFKEVARLLVVTEDEPIEYRLHYDETGNIVMCSMQNHPASERYIVVDKETYDSYHKYRIVKGKVELINYDTGVLVPFVKSTKGFLVVNNHAALLLEANEEYNNTQYYDHRNN